MATKNSNRIVVPEAKAAMEQFKQQAASDVGVKIHQRNIKMIHLLK